MQHNLSDDERNAAEVSGVVRNAGANAQDTAALINSDLLGGDIIGSEANENDNFPAEDDVKIIEGGITDVTGKVALGGTSDVGGTGEPAATADVGATTGAAGLDPTSSESQTGI